ncbi:MAG: DUF2752 domain-containing protein [Lachnospiraceae bacterium]|nr:DUF2752 domain-containing protein [Lachnospiraceae bacterium]
MNIFIQLANWLAHETQDHICVFHELTGLYCPGCGGTRAVIALLSGHPWISFLYHPIVIYSVVAICYTWLQFVYCKIRHVGFRFHNSILWIALIIVIANFIIKNLLLFIV